MFIYALLIESVTVLIVCSCEFVKVRVFGMSSVGRTQSQGDILKNTADGTKFPDFCEKFLTFPLIDGKPKEMIADFLKFCDEYINAI